MAFEVNPTTLPNPVVGVFYTQTLTFSGGLAPYSYFIDSGFLPTGLSFSQPEGIIVGTTLTISGTPTVTGPFLMNVQFFDNESTLLDRIFIFDVEDAPPVTTSRRSRGVVFPYIFYPISENFLPGIELPETPPDPAVTRWFCTNAYFDGSHYCVSCSNGQSNFTVCHYSRRAAQDAADTKVKEVSGNIIAQPRNILTPQINYRRRIYNYDTLVESNSMKFYRYKISK